jgi:D-aminopeptidase
MTDDVNAAIDGAFEAGADDAIVADGHWISRIRRRGVRPV